MIEVTLHGNLNSFGLKWRQGNGYWSATPDKAFWDAWKTMRESIKKAGFFVKKRTGGYKVYVCRELVNKKAQDMMIARRNAKKSTREWNAF